MTQLLTTDEIVAMFDVDWMRGQSAGIYTLQNVSPAEMIRDLHRIFEIEGIVLHSKTVTIDGVWSAIGSSNFDHRSVLFNDEVEAIVLGRETAGELERLFEQDQASAKEIRLEEWEQRPVTERLTDFFQRTLQYLL